MSSGESEYSRWVLDEQMDADQVAAVQVDATGTEVPMEVLEYLQTLEGSPQESNKVETEAVINFTYNITGELVAKTYTGLGGCSLMEPDEPVPSELQVQQSLLKFNFNHKLHLAASSEHVAFINWSADGQLLQLDYIGLQDHLSGNHSMFRSRSVLEFIRQILEVGFTRVLPETELECRPQLYYQHGNFKPDQLERLLHMSTPSFEHSLLWADKPASQFEGFLELGANEKDHSYYSPLQLARFRFQALLSYHNDVRLLQEQEPTAEEMMPRRGRVSSSRQSVKPTLTPALTSKHTNPLDSVTDFQTDQVPSYAGFYGRVKPSLVNQFFAEYLPRYGDRIVGYKDVVVDATKSNAFQQNLPIGMVSSEEEEDLEQSASHDAAGDNDDVIVNPAADDIELEQVMQELCGVGSEGDEVVEPKEDDDLETKEQSPLKPKAKRRKLARKCANLVPEKDSVPEPPGDDNVVDLMLSAAAAEAHIQEEQKENEDSDKDLKNQRKVQKRRRYDLRTTKSKRPR